MTFDDLVLPTSTPKSSQTDRMNGPGRILRGLSVASTNDKSRRIRQPMGALLG